MSDDRIEVARYRDATEAREAARRLLATGISPEAARDGADHVILVDRRDADEALRALGGGAPEPDDSDDDIPAGIAAGDDTTDSTTTATTGEPAGDDADVPPAGAPTPAPARPEPTPESGAHGAAGAATDATDEVDLADLVVDERGFVVVAVADDADGARAMAARLVEHGIGPELVSAFETGHANPMTAMGSPEAVQVLEIDMDRAMVLLGVEELPRRLTAPPAAGPASTSPGVDRAGPSATPPGTSTARLRKRSESEEVVPYLGGRVNVTRRQMRTMIAIYIAALILIPLAFFYATRWILRPDIEEPDLPSQETVPAIHLAPPAEP